MPGSSLWLLPPAGSRVETALTGLINNTIPSHFPDLTPPSFLPHVTLTSDIPASVYGDDAQAWLDSLELPPSGIMPVIFSGLDTEAAFFRKLTIRVDKHPMLGRLAGIVRRAAVGGEEVGDWVEGVYRPHCSLMYADTMVAEEKLVELRKVVREAHVAITDEDQLHGLESGWTGGRIVLVPTDKEVHEWKPIAERKL